VAEAALSREAVEAELFALGSRYWDRHPFHLRLHEGRARTDEVRSWVANRWYYQRILTQKNAAIIANCPLPEVRRRWLTRITFQDGTAGGGDSAGGLNDWLVLADAVGLSREEVLDERHVLRGVRFAVDGYLHFCLTHPWTDSAAAALTELFSPDLMAARVAAWREHYDWIKPDGFAYFETRIPVVRHDSQYTLELVLTHCQSPDQQRAAIAALAFKCDVLGAMLDAIDYAATAR
jgi:pyrroloquinoline-quinone synthase